MDFGTLLSVAQKNETNHKQQPTACYQTKFAPPKKLTKQTKALSQNIKKFLARKEEEEKQKALEEKKKKENLLALRDHKAQSRINKHLKVCKAANKSVLADAVDNENTAVTLAGPSQPDEDDYGYVSQEASAFYNQLMNKYNSVTKKSEFSSNGKKTVKDIASTKDRVRQALRQQEEEEALGHRRKRKTIAGQKGAENEEKEVEKEPEIEKEKDKDSKPKVKRKGMPPPMDFGELLKIAEKKQHEPVVIEMKPKVEEPERLMTKKQRKEYILEKEARERREHREKTGELVPKVSNTSSSSSKSAKPQLGKIPKTLPSASSSSEKVDKPSCSTANLTIPSKVQAKPLAVPLKKSSTSDKSTEKSSSVKQSVAKSSERDSILEERKKLEAERRKLEEMRQAIEEEKKKLAKTKTKQQERVPEKIVVKPKIPEKSIPPKEVKAKPTTPSVGGPSQKPRVPAVLNGKPKQFPPPDLKQLKAKHNMPKDNRKPPAGHKRRIYDDEDEEEYDSELDDFIDDGPEEEGEDYSKYISEIFGYDKNRYKRLDYEEEDDDAAMESSFAQQLKEEYVSTKIGIMEDLEDMRMEALEKKRKAMMRKKIKK